MWVPGAGLWGLGARLWGLENIGIWGSYVGVWRVFRNWEVSKSQGYIEICWAWGFWVGLAGFHSKVWGVWE